MPMNQEGGPRRTKFQPLADYLAALPDDRATLMFAELEAIFSGPLPMNGYITSARWHSARYAHVRRWEAAGWHARYDRRNACVHFTRNTE